MPPVPLTADNHFGPNEALTPPSTGSSQGSHREFPLPLPGVGASFVGINLPTPCNSTGPVVEYISKYYTGPNVKVLQPELAARFDEESLPESTVNTTYDLVVVGDASNVMDRIVKNSSEMAVVLLVRLTMLFKNAKRVIIMDYDLTHAEYEWFRSAAERTPGQSIKLRLEGRLPQRQALVLSAPTGALTGDCNKSEHMSKLLDYICGVYLDHLREERDSAGHMGRKIFIPVLRARTGLIIYAMLCATASNLGSPRSRLPFRIRVLYKNSETDWATKFAQDPERVSEEVDVLIATPSALKPGLSVGPKFKTQISVLENTGEFTHRHELKHTMRLIDADDLTPWHLIYLEKGSKDYGF